MSGLNARFTAHLAAGGAVLTANQRQARIIRRLYDRAQVAAGRHCWPTAEVLTLEAWLAARWQETVAADGSLPTLLADTQAAWPWRRSAASHLDPTLVALPDLAGAARRAWVQLQRFGATLQQLDGEIMTRDQRQFLDWARAVEAELATKGWLDPALLEVALARHATRLAPGPALLLAGFDRPVPALEALLGRLARSGFAVERASPGDSTGSAWLCAAADPPSETRAWLGWARQRLEADPGARLAVIVPDLQRRRYSIERSLEALLQADLELPGSRERDRVFDLAGGEPLDCLAITQATLDVLGCSGPRIELASVSRLLRSRYVLPAAALDVRVGLDLALREAGLSSWPTAALSRRARTADCAALAEALDATQRLLQDGPRRRATDDWARTFGEVLSAWGWPGSGPLASDEYQAAEALRERLAGLAALALAAPVMTLSEARDEFGRLAALPFQPERGEAALWVLDALEPPGVEFDGLWVAGLTAAQWPRAASHDPFLPLSLQRRLGMPGVTAADTFVEAVRTVAAWRATAPEVVFSWPLTEDDARVEASRVLPPQLPPFDPAPWPATRAGVLLGVRDPEELRDDLAPPLTGPAHGGSRILELQAKCPFRAFAELRLAARPLEEPAAGVEARARGLVLHRALELIWRALGRRAALETLTPRHVAALVDRSLDAAIAARLPAELGPRAMALEREWQRAAILRLLELERSRPDFEVVGMEAPLEQHLAGLPLSLRVDRIDRVGDGLVILDYKTGQAAIHQWRGTRPDAPQLPLYAVLSGAPVSGVAFAVAGAHEAAFRGVGSSGELLPGMHAAERFELTDERETGFSWEDVRRRWAGWLAVLATRHCEGDAAVDPKLPQTCRSCHLQTLCRVAPGFEPSGEDEGDD